MTYVDPRQRRIGTLVRDNVEAALTSLSLAPFTRRLNMPIDAVRDLVTGAVADAVNPALKAYFPL